MGIPLRLTAAFHAALAFLPAAEGTETRIQRKDLPAVVQAAVKQQSQGATLKGLTREVEKGATRYEAELSVNGRARDVTFDESGKIVSVEQEVSLASIPAAARAAILRSAGSNKLLLVESVTEGGATFYEAHIRAGAGEREVKVDANGRAVK